MANTKILVAIALMLGLSGVSEAQTDQPFVVVDGLWVVSVERADITTLCLDTTTSDACFERVSANIIGVAGGDTFRVTNGTLQFGGGDGVSLTEDGDGQMTICGEGNGSDECLTINLDDTANAVELTSSTGLVIWDLNTIVPYVEGSAGVDCTPAAAVTTINGIVTSCS